jgi:tetratricopeptide (TPR) repeat protein
MLNRKNTLWLLLIAVLSTSPAESADPFYENLLIQGARDYSVGSYNDAAHKLRIACFGLLDEPGLLTEGLVRLSLAQARSGDNAALRETFDRIMDVESLFGTYADADIPDGLRREFEILLRAQIPATQLSGLPSLQTLLLRPTQVGPEEIATAVPATEESTEESPESLLQDALEKFRRRPAKARPIVDRLLASDPENQQGLCLRGQIGVRLGECNEALEGLPSCPTLHSDVDLAAYYLACLVEEGRLLEARSFESSLASEMRERRPISRLMSKLPAAIESEVMSSVANQQEAAPEESIEAEVRPEELATEAETPPLEGITDEGLAQVREIQSLVRSATSLGDLEEPAQLAVDLANKNPDSQAAQYLAAEIAYRRSDWSAAVEYFKRAGAPTQDQPLLVFYMAVSLFETGSLEEARSLIELALPLLERTEFVNSYVARILE